MTSAPKNPLDLANALTAFEPAELARLRRYRKKTDELRHSRFMCEAQEFRPWTDENSIVFYEISNASREVVNAVVPPLRLLYSQRDTVSFARIRAMIGGHCSSRGTTDAESLRELLRLFKERVHKVMAVDPDMGHYRVESGQVIEAHEPTTREIFEDWLYGEYLHDDEERLARIDRWRGIGIHEFLFLEAARELAAAYVDFADAIVSPILDDPRA